MSTAEAPAAIERWISAAEAARIIGCHLRRVAILAKAGRLRAHRPPMSYTRYWRADCEQLAPPDYGDESK